MIELKNLSKAFGKDKQVIENLNCTIPDNAIYGLVGANGAGKSTLLRLICSIYEPDKGEILIDNVNLTMKTLKKILYLSLMTYSFLTITI